jgi:hypothetical protein
MLRTICDADFYGLPLSDFQASFDFWTAKGYWPETLSTGSTLAGSFRAGAPRPVWAGMTERQLLRHCAQQAERGYAPHQVSASSGGYRFEEGATSLGYPILFPDPQRTPTFSCIWKPTEAASETWLLTLSDFERINAEKIRAAWVLHDLCGYSTDGSVAGLRVVATWSRRPYGRWVAALGLTQSQVRCQQMQMVAGGYQPTRVSAYWINHHIRYTTLYEQPLEPDDWYLYANMSGPLFQTRHTYLATIGYRLHHVCGQTGRYSAIWLR